MCLTGAKDEYGLRVADTIIDFFEELRKAGIEYIGIPGDEVPSTEIGTL